mgnify:CR=1 FL=1
MDKGIVTPDSKGQEKIAATLSYLLFFIPLLMGQKTDFTTFHMRQSFLLFVAYLAISIVMSIIPWILLFLGGILNLIIFFHAVFLAWKAYSGEKYAIPYIYDNANRLIKALTMDNFFTPGK